MEYIQDKRVLAGKAGERRIQEILLLHKASNHLDGRIFKNVYLGSGMYTKETDFVSITSRGIFVIEVKNWQGKVNGALNDDKWEQIKPNGLLYPANPIKQNRKHTEKLKSVLNNDIKEFPFYPITVFVKNNAPKIESDELTNLSSFTHFLDLFGRGEQIAKKDVEMACALLDAYVKKCGVTEKQHLRNVLNIRK